MRRRPPRRPNTPAERDESNEPRVNDRIRVPRVLVIDEEGNKLGEFLTEDAIALALERGFDLVEVAPNARPPVCRLTDYGKLKYEKKKKDAQARKNQVQVQLKELKLRPKTDDHDLGFKVDHAKRFLEHGHKVKITVRFRGREMAHKEIGEDQCLHFAEMVKEYGAVEMPPRMEGRQMFMILVPTRKPKPRGEREELPPLPPDDSDLDDDDDEDDDDEDDGGGEAEAPAS